MQQIELTARKREAGKNAAKRLRREGLLPAVIYGKDIESLPIAVDAREFTRAYESTGRNVLITLTIEGDGEASKHTVMVKEVQRHPLRREIIHADFHRISLEDKITTVVPLVLTGEEQVEKAGGILQHQLREIEVKVLPTEIPEAITADVAELEVGDSLTVGDLRVPEGVEVLTPPEEVIVSVVAPKVVEEAPEAGEEAPEEGAPETEEARAEE